MKKDKLRLGIVGTVGVPAKYGGFETLVHHLVIHLNHRFDMTVFCSTKAYNESERMDNWNGARLDYIPLKANGLQSIFYDLWSMLRGLKRCDALLILGVSGCIFLPFIKLFTKKKIIVNIDGLEWRRPKWNRFAKAFLLYSEKIACLYADEIITDNRILKEYVKIRYNRDSRLIEYGADHVFAVPVTSDTRQRFPFLNEKYAFKVARIEPENNIHIILEAFARLPHQAFVLVGNWNNSNYGKELRQRYAKYDHLYLMDPIYESKELNLLRSNAHFYVHGHSAGGTNPSLVEAMHLGLPVLAYDVIYNRVTTNNQAVFFEHVTDLQHLIANVEQLSLADIAHNLKVIAEKKYTWEKMAMLYGDVVDNRPPVIIPVQPEVPLPMKTLQRYSKSG